MTENIYTGIVPRQPPWDFSSCIVADQLMDQILEAEEEDERVTQALSALMAVPKGKKSKSMSGALD